MADDRTFIDKLFELKLSDEKIEDLLKAHREKWLAEEQEQHEIHKRALDELEVVESHYQMVVLEYYRPARRALEDHILFCLDVGLPVSLVARIVGLSRQRIKQLEPTIRLRQLQDAKSMDDGTLDV